MGYCALIDVRIFVRARDIDKIPIWCPRLRCLNRCMCSGTSFPTFVCVVDCIMVVLEADLFVALVVSMWERGASGMLPAASVSRILRRDSRSPSLLIYVYRVFIVLMRSVMVVFWVVTVLSSSTISLFC